MAQRGNRFAKAAVESADRIGHPVDEETRREADPSTDPERESTEDTQGKPEEDSTLYEGVCEGGPMDGMPGQSRYPKGFLLSDPRDSRAWVYDYDETRNVFVSRKKDVRDTVRELDAAEGANYDVRAFDRRFMRGDLG